MMMHEPVTLSMSMKVRRVLAGLLFLCAGQPVIAFDISGSKWPGGQTDFYVSLDGVSATGVMWQTAFLDAIDSWNSQSLFQFDAIEDYRDPCLEDGLNGVDFAMSLCGTEFGDGALAVTVRRFEFDLLGPPRITEADVIYNGNDDFDVFDGNLVQFGKSFNGIDFKRIALHELGHVLGLEHSEVAPSIMAKNVGNVFELQADDIEGANTLYSGLANCQVSSLRFGTSSDALGQGDCTVIDLTVGGADDSFVDVYRFELASDSVVEFEMNSAVLDGVLILADSALRFLDADNKTSGLCNSTLTRELAAGSYLVLANTYDVPPKTECTNSGDYILRAYVTSPELHVLPDPTSLGGIAPLASFSGGITADGGATYQNRFTPTQSLDIHGEIQIDPLHRNRGGFLVVAALVGDSFLFLNGQGQFVEYSGDPAGAPHAVSKVLSASEQIQIASNLVPASLGISEIEVNFYLGYGLTAAPGELYFHLTPLNLTVSP